MSTSAFVGFDFPRLGFTSFSCWSMATWSRSEGCGCIRWPPAVDEEVNVIPPIQNETPQEGPAPEMLAGVYLYVEAEEDLTVRPCQPPQPAADNGAERPTQDQLAGVYLRVEGPEDLTVHPPTCSTPPNKANVKGGETTE